MSKIDSPDPSLEEAEADRRLSADRRDIVATLAKADNRMRHRDYRAANAFYGQVGRLAGEGVPLERSELLRARDACVWLAERFRLNIVEGLAAKGIAGSAMHPRFAKSLAIMFGERQRDPVFERFPQLPQMYFYPDLPYLQFDDPARHPWTSTVEGETEIILREALGLLESSGNFAPYVSTDHERPQGDVHGLLDDPSWSTLDLTIAGRADPERTALSPHAFATISSSAPLCQIPSRAPSIMYSLLRAGSSIPPHTGMINTRLICHLPLIIPGPGRLRVGEQVREWEVGKLLLFDDTVEHDARNNAGQDRLVLIFDVWRPELDLDERQQIQALFEVVDEG
ncbi:aspartyl/asparaginyl beta-hydroxylase domain-containing protein [Erythrobacter mangrovi]|uniref:Aspartyl/asparaginyl beta-hydroxylase domain-containing protein n=1 Tax=Erythrobacter mangrovi TaxID=2739433 RepID=A0A7D4CDD1_9SPHN|nr:aspartyl/asparaginyl beta-hydroxylase domain-containing protein [Erythrobacter mangrovi]QKG71549.1 aspartyl/asparaginyl beta-hydroxylase domain-containing protein [Erythrobacter mangrovi]